MDNFINQYLKDCGFNLLDNVFCRRLKRTFYKEVWSHVVDKVYFEGKLWQ